MTLTLSYFWSKNIYSIKRILNEYHMKLKTISNFVLCIQLIKSPTRVTCSTSSLIGYILTTSLNRVSHKGIIDVGYSNHQLIYCTRKFSRTKVGSHKQTTFRSLKIYTAEDYKEVRVTETFQIIKTLVMWIKLMKTSFKNWWASLIS